MSTRRILSIDIETYSAADIGSVGSYRYIDDPTFEILLFGYAWDDEPVQVVDLTDCEEVPAEVVAALTCPDVTKTAWNCAFERIALEKHFGLYLPPEQWQDSMILAGVCGLPMSLDGAGKALGLGEDAAKDKAGKALIRYFCSPCRPTKTNGQRTRNMPEHDPEKWAAFIEYNRQDVVAERAIRKMLEEYIPGETEHRFWCLDQRINEKGMRVDLPLVRHAIEFDARYKGELTAQAIALTGIENPNSVSQIKAWLMEQEGIAVPSLNKKAVADVVAKLSTDKAKEFMTLRTRLAKSSTKKYEKMAESSCADGHARGMFQFYGANRTGRFAGRLIQLQNLPQNHMPDLDVARQLVLEGDYETTEELYDAISPTLSELIRTALIPEPGHQFIVADFSAIEARVLAFLAKEQWRLDTFEAGGDIYCASASQMFHVPVVKHGENGHLRQKGKVAELALGYGGGVNALKAFGADKMGMTDEEMASTVDLWREASPNIVKMWKTLERAAIRTIVKRIPSKDPISGTRFDFEHGILWMTLPSGRRIAYYGAAYEESRWKNGKALSYMGIDQKTKKWCRVETWGGKLTENCWAAGTPVLTACGWKAIEEVQAHELVFDGVDWVECGGAVYRGHKLTISVNGQRVTPDHLILTTEGWKRAEETDGLNRAEIRNPDRAWAIRTKRLSRKMAVDSAVRLWPCSQCGFPRPQNCQILWLPDKADPLKTSENTRDVEASSICRVAQHGTALHKPGSSCVEELRRPGYYGLRKMATQLRELLGRYGRKLRTRFGSGSKRQQRRVLTGELSMGYEKNEQQEQAGQPICGNLPWPHDGGRAVGADRNWRYYTPVSDERRNHRRLTVDTTRRDEPVYDLLDCGPRHRFVIACDGGPLIVHNCTQATARDCLRDAMLALDAAGFDIRAHVHDEVIITEPIGGRTVDEVCEIMGRELPWAPGLPLKAAGYSCPYYQKD